MVVCNSNQLAGNLVDAPFPEIFVPCIALLGSSDIGGPNQWDKVGPGRGHVRLGTTQEEEGSIDRRFIEIQSMKLTEEQEDSRQKLWNALFSPYFIPAILAPGKISGPVPRPPGGGSAARVGKRKGREEK